MRRRAIACLAVAALMGSTACQRRRPSPASVSSAPTASAAQALEQGRKAEARGLVRTEISRRWSLPAHLGEKHCPDSRLASLPASQRELALAYSDSRYEARSMLPLVVTRHLVDPDPTRLESGLVGVDHSQSSEAAASTIRWLAARRYIAVFHVVDYAGARRFHKRGHRHAQWDAGRILAWLVIHDVASGKAICQTRLVVIGDAKGAPLAVRLRSITRKQLTADLGKRLREAAGPALARLSSVLYLRGSERARRLAAR